MLRLYTTGLTHYAFRLKDGVREHLHNSFMAAYPQFALDAVDFDAIAEERATAITTEIVLEVIAAANQHHSPYPDVDGSIRTLNALTIDPEAEMALRDAVAESPEQFMPEELFEQHCLTVGLSPMMEMAAGWFRQRFMQELYNVVGKAWEDCCFVYATRALIQKQFHTGQIVLALCDLNDCEFITAKDTIMEIRDDAMAQEWGVLIQDDCAYLPESFASIYPEHEGEYELYALRAEVVAGIEKL